MKKCKKCGKEFDPQNSPYENHGPTCGKKVDAPKKGDFVGPSDNLPEDLYSAMVISASSPEVKSDNALLDLDKLLANQEERDILEQAKESEQGLISKNLETISHTKKLPGDHVASAQDRFDLAEIVREWGPIKQVDKTKTSRGDFSVITLNDQYETKIYHAQELRAKISYAVEEVLKDNYTNLHLPGENDKDMWTVVYRQADKETKMAIIKDYLVKTYGLKNLKAMSPKDLSNLEQTISSKDLGLFLEGEWVLNAPIMNSEKVAELEKKYPGLTRRKLTDAIVDFCEIKAKNEKPFFDENIGPGPHYIYKDIIGDSDEPIELEIEGKVKKTNWRMF